MQVIAVGDVFIKEEYYYESFSKFPEFSLNKTFYFGNSDKGKMRSVVYKIEQSGPDSVPLPEGLMEVIESAEILMVHLCPVPSELIKRAKNLKYILSNRGGTENIDIKTASELGVFVLNNPLHNANAVAEYTIALILSLTRNIVCADRSLRAGIWREQFPNSKNIYEMKSLTVGLVGFGGIARKVVEKLSAFHTRIIVTDPNVTSDDPDINKFNCQMTSLEYLLRSADIVSMHARYHCTKPLLDIDELKMLKSSAYLINTARPHLINNSYLLRILSEGKIMGAALDVFEQEPISPNDPILLLDNVILSNHRAGDTINSYIDSPEMLLAECRKHIAEKSLDIQAESRLQNDGC